MRSACPVHCKQPRKPRLQYQLRPRHLRGLRALRRHGCQLFEWHSDYHGLTANLRKRFGHHYEFQASYTWSHAIDDSTDLQSTLTPQDSYYPRADRSTSLFDQRHRFVFSGVYQSGRLAGAGFASKFFSNWTFAPLIEFGSGRPFNIITSGDDNFQLSSLTGRPNVLPSGTGTNGCGYPACLRSFRRQVYFQEPCFLPAPLGNSMGLWRRWTATWAAMRRSRPGRYSTTCGLQSE